MVQAKSTWAEGLARAPADPSAELARAYAAHRHQVYRLALRYGGGRGGWAEDVTQDVFLRLLDHLEHLEDRDDLWPWLYRVTANACISRLRRDRIVAAASLRWLFSADPDGPPTPEALSEARSELERASRILDGLPPKERVAFCMHHLDGKELTEIGSILGHSKGYVSKLISRAEERVKRRERSWR
jgi:RNA polymerase sigma-70 factor, ECF subfamily